MTTLQDIQPNALPQAAELPQPAPVPEAPEAPAPEGGLPKIFEDLPDDVAALPVIQGLSVGMPAAVRVQAEEYYPELAPIEAQLPEILDAGLGIYVSKSGDTILYNPIFVSEQELQVAEQKGALDQVAPHFSEISGSMPQTAPPAEAKKRGANAEKLKTYLATAQAAPAAAPVDTPPASQETALTKTRLKNLMPASGPASGPKPGGGRVLNGLMQVAV